MRTIKRISLQLNKSKQKEIDNLIEAYCKEKDKWLVFLSSNKNIRYTKQFRFLRDSLVKDGYKSPYGLPPSHWKNALDDACKQMDMYWQATFTGFKKYVASNENFNEKQKHWCFSIMKNYEAFSDVRCFKYPSLKACDDAKLIGKAGNFLNRLITKQVKNMPRVKLVRSMSLTSNVYSLKEKGGKQFVSVSSLTKGKPIVIPLLGYTAAPKGQAHFGSVKLVKKSKCIEVQYTADIKYGAKVTTENIVAVDIGYTEVFTDDLGNQYGTNLGALISSRSDKLTDKDRKRNKLRALYNKHVEKGNYKKAKRIKKYNLGEEKRSTLSIKTKTAITCEVNASINKLLRERTPETLVTEKLSNQFTAKSGKKWNRRLNQWVRGELQERIEFKTMVGCSNHKQVNPAYTSQTCPQCGYLDKGNRSGDKFQCLQCGHSGHADWIAALNLKSRYSDQEITMYSSAASVKKILDERFHRHFETLNGGRFVPELENIPY